MKLVSAVHGINFCWDGEFPNATIQVRSVIIKRETALLGSLQSNNNTGGRLQLALDPSAPTPVTVTVGSHRHAQALQVCKYRALAS